MKLTEKAIAAIRNNKRVRARLQLDLNKSEYTIARYIINNDIMLTTATALAVIKEETGMTEDELIEAVTV